MTWRNGRELQNLTKGGKKTSYEYDVSGLRNLKTNADGSYSVYYWLGNLLLAEERHTGNSTRVLVFSYDENNSPIGFQFKTNDGPWYYYLYAKNIQGDIVALYRRDINADGTRSATHIANYEYDPWGKILSIKNAAGQDISSYPDNSANVNPLRYRGYYYDNESGFYYLQSRYYDPTIGRFINADTYASTGQDFIGYNMFAYCGNNPVICCDPSGDAYIITNVGSSAVELLSQWLFGDGSAQSYGDDSTLAWDFKNSGYMNRILEECLEEYISTGQNNFSGSGSISGLSEFDLWMGVRSFDYEVTISSETRTSGIIFKEQYTEYTFSVKITDEYNFNSGKDAGDGLGSVLNNAAYNLHKKGIGHDYKWKLNYTTSYSGHYRNSNFIPLLL